MPLNWYFFSTLTFSQPKPHITNKGRSLPMEQQETTKQIDRLLAIMERLRAADGCPWDRKQTPESLKPFILEEAYELLEAIDSKEQQDICDEAGDLLLQIVFLAQIFKERGQFRFIDIVKSISDKMIRRHPHVFANACPQAKTSHWDNIKQTERNNRGKKHTLKDQLPQNLPALKTSAKIIKKYEQIEANEVYSDLEDSLSVISKTCEKDNMLLATTLGQLLYSTVKLATLHQLDAEDLLRQFNDLKIDKIDNSIKPSEKHTVF